MAAYKVDISLRAQHPDDDLAALIERVGIAPSQRWKKGDPRRTPKGKLLRGTRDDSYCSIPLQVARTSSLTEAVSDSLKVVRRVKKQLREIVASGGKVSIAVGWFCTGDAGTSLPSDLLAELGRAGVALDLYLYFAASDSNEDD